MNGKRITVLFAGCFLVAALAQTGWAQPPSVYQQTEYKGREIGNLTGSIYYARMDDYLSVFMVTSEGIIIAEPVGTDFATWLKAELARRFNVPVKYVIYSHRHADHGSGAAVWADTARLIGHENMLKYLVMPPANTPLPNNVRQQDANGNGTIEESEAPANLKAVFATYDKDKNGALNGAELTVGPLSWVKAPDLTYTQQVNINLGGKRVEVIPMPIAHADDNTIVRFVDGTNVLFASDWITVNRVPFGGDVARLDEIALVKRVEAMDFEHFICSHGKLGKKADVTANLKYREELRDAVSKAIAAGQTVEQAQASVTMDAYKNWEFYTQQRPGNVAGAFRAIQAKQ
jgi:glyoxylase-like metal-dependent hydrolase (beta-lactamase superfamily II)